MRIKQTELRVCYISLKDLPHHALQSLSSGLEKADRIQSQKFLRAEDRIAFAVGRLLTRRMLSNCADAPPGGWHIELNGSGKPVLTPSENMPDLRFNITHCQALVAAVVAIGRDVGIDAEFVGQTSDFLAIARTHLPPVEVRFLEGLSETCQRTTFFGLWTLREAYLKATGEGLAGNFADISFDLDPPAVYAASSQNGKMDDWFLWRDKPTQSHVVAVAAQRTATEDLICHQMWLKIEDLFL